MLFEFEMHAALDNQDDLALDQQGVRFTGTPGGRHRVLRHDPPSPMEWGTYSSRGSTRQDSSPSSPPLSREGDIQYPGAPPSVLSTPPSTGKESVRFPRVAVPSTPPIDPTLKRLRSDVMALKEELLHSPGGGSTPGSDAAASKLPRLLSPHLPLQDMKSNTSSRRHSSTTTTSEGIASAEPLPVNLSSPTLEKLAMR